jgi:predicted MFS family arabinose efflux permease
MSSTKVKNHFRIMLSVSAAYTIAIISNWLQPKLIGELIGSYGLDEVSAGLIAGAEMAALAFTSMICARILSHITYLRIISYAVSLLFIGNIISLHIESFPSLLTVRIVCGVGAGMLLMVSTAAIADFDDSDSAYGQINTVSIMSGIAAFGMASVIASLVSSAVTFSIILVFVIVLMPFTFLMPKSKGISLSRKPGIQAESKNISFDIILITTGVFISCGVLAASWAFYFVLGERAGFTPDQINRILAYTILFALFGSVIASVIGHRYGRFRPLLLALILMTTSNMCLCLSSDAIVYQIFTGLNLMGLYLFVPYFLGYASASDPSGRGPAIVAGAYMLAPAVGPFLGGALFSLFGVEILAWLTLVVNLVSFLIFYVVNHRQKKLDIASAN